MDVTLAVWVALLHGRRQWYDVTQPTRNVNPALDDPAALAAMLKAFPFPGNKPDAMHR
jgi:hypothetical protein